MATKVELTASQKDEIKTLILLKVSDAEIKSRYNISSAQLGSLKGAAAKQSKQIKKNMPVNAADNPIPTIPLEVSVSELLKVGSEARIVIRLIP